MPPTHDLSALLEHQDWIRRLAHSLVSDPNVADDLTQDTWVSVLRRPPRTPGPVRAWLATVLRRQLRQRQRSGARRRERERACAREEATPGVDEVVARASVHEELVRGVLALDEPYRTTVLLRFFEGLSYREIARSQGTTTATVNSRVTRGLKRLRARAERDRRGRGETLAAWIAPLLPDTRSSPATHLGLGAVNLLKATAVVSVLGGGALWVWGPAALRPAPRASVEEPPSARVTSVEAKPVAPVRVDGAAARSAVAVGVKPVEPGSPARGGASASFSVRGIVLSTSGTPVSAVGLSWRGGSPDARVHGEVVSDAAGRFEIDAPVVPLWITGDDPRWVTVLGGAARAGTGAEPVVVVAPPTTFAGVVIDADGRPVQETRLRMVLPAGFVDGLDYVLDHSESAEWEVVTGADGAFRLERVPLVAGALLLASADGFELLQRELPPHADERLALVLSRPDPESGTLSGVVVDRLGRRVAGASVSAGGVLARTDELGSFRVTSEGLRRRSWVRAVARGAQPALLRFAEPLAPDEVTWPDHVVLELGPPTLAIEGRVHDSVGAPAAGARVWLEDPTLLGFVERDPVQVETLQVDDRLPFWSFVETDARGAFRIAGLGDRPYRLRAIDPTTLAATTVGPVHAGDEGVRITLPGCEPGFGGVVRTTEGVPVANASVRYEAVTWKWKGHSTGVARDAVSTDVEGRFELPGACFDEDSLISVGGAGIVDRFFQGAELPFEHGRLQLVLEPRQVGVEHAHFRVALAEPASADAFSILDGDGRCCKLRYARASEGDQSDRMPLFQGRSHQLATRSTGRTLVLFRGGEEVARHPIQLLGAGEITVLRF